MVTPEHFAQTVVEDYNLTYNYHSIIAKQIHDQLNDFKAHSNHYDGEGGEFLSTENTLQAGSLDEENDAWWEAWRKRLRTESRVGRSGKSQNRRRRRAIKLEDDESSLPQDEKPMSVEDFPLKEDLFSEDMRILIKVCHVVPGPEIRFHRLVKLDIIVGSVKLDDQFEWDLDNVSASPEYFAEVYTSELGLGGEFKQVDSCSWFELVLIRHFYLERPLLTRSGSKCRHTKNLSSSLAMPLMVNLSRMKI